MEEPGRQTNWQSLGSTLNQELRYVTHLDPREHSSSDGGVHKQRLNRGYSTRSARSKEVPSLHRNTSMRLTTRLKRFLHRLTWHKRSKSYIFGKKYLQRQPSFVMTPDRSSFTYHFRSRDLVKSKPHPRYEHSSQPIAAWKHANPMTVLLNKGQVAGPQPETEDQNSQSDPAVAANSETHNTLTQREVQGDNAEAETHSASVLDRTSHTTPQTWQKVSLPVKQDRTSGSSQERSDLQASEQSTPRNTTNPSTSGSGSKSGSQPRSRTNISFGSIDIPPTPLETRKLPPKAVDLPSRSLPFAADGQPQVPRSPTSARSMYRPESWRRSAIISRNELVPESDPSELDIAIEFVGAWGTYLKRAIAVRAVAERRQKSWELHTERRWSYNLPYDSEYASSFDSSSASSQSRSEDYDVRSSNSDGSSHNSSGHDTSSGPHSEFAEPREMEDSSLWHSAAGDIDDQGSLPDAASESSSLASRQEGEEVLSTSASADTEARLSSSSIQYTPEAISIPSSMRTRTSVLQQSPMKSTSSLAPPNSPRALAAMARTSAERKRFSDSVDGAEKRYSTLFQQGNENRSLLSAARLDAEAGGDFGELKGLSEWPPEDSDKETAPSNSSDNGEVTRISALRVNKAQAVPDVSQNIEKQPDEFDFTDLSVPRKRPLPVSPVSTPVGSSVDLSLDKAGERPASHRRHSSSSINSGVEDAPSLLKSQSVRKHMLESSHKRVKSSVSRENLLLMRQNTLHSQWAEEESDTDASEHFGIAT